MSKLIKKCPNCCSTTEVKLKPHLIIAGSITFFLGVIDLGITALCFSYLTNYFYGAWWSAMIVSLTGLLGSFSIRRGVVVAACVTSVFAILMAFIGVVVDGVGNTQMDSLQTCASTDSYYDTENYVYYGSSKYDSDAFTCVQHYYTDDTDCYCVDSQANCFFLNGQTDCGVILTSYRTNLKVAIAMDTLCLLSVLAFSVVTCFSLCCPYGFKKKKTTNFRNDLKADDRGSVTSNPLQNDSRPVLSRVKTFAFGSGSKSSTESAAASETELQKTPTKDSGSMANPMQKNTPTTTTAASAAAAESAFSSNVSDFEFSSPEPPKSPTPTSSASTPSANTPGGGAKPPQPPPPPRAPTATQAIGGGMASNPLARKRQLTKNVSGIDKDAVNALDDDKPSEDA